MYLHTYIHTYTHTHTHVYNIMHIGYLLVIRLDAAHKVRVGRAQGAHELVELALVLVGDEARALRAALGAARDGVDGANGEQLREDGRRRRRHAELQVLVQVVRVLLEPAGRLVDHLPRKVGDDERLLAREPRRAAAAPLAAHLGRRHVPVRKQGRWVG